MSPLDEIATELYATEPGAFIAARDECVKKARADGDAALAREVAKLRRPTQSAWLVNQLVREDGAPLDDLLGLADDYAAALADRDGARLTELTARRRDLETQLVARATELGAEAGTPPGDGTLSEVRETLDAAVSDSEIAEQVRAGRLAKTARPSWGAQPAATPSAALAPPGATAKEKPRTKKASRDDDEGRQAREADKAAREAESARAARGEAAAELAERTAEAERANAELEQLSERLEQLRAEARDVAQQVTTARQAAVRAERRRAQAERRHQKLG